MTHLPLDSAGLAARRSRRRFFVILASLVVVAAPVAAWLWYFSPTERAIRDLRSDKRYERAISAWRLGKMRASSARAVNGLINLLDDDDTTPVQASGDVHTPEWREFVDYLDGMAVGDLPSETCQPDSAAESALLKIGKPATGPLIESLRDSETRPAVRWHVAAILLQIDVSRALPAVTATLLTSNDRTFRKSAFVSMAIYGREKAIPSLMRCLAAHEHLQRIGGPFSLAFELGRMGDAAVEPLIPFLNDANPVVREVAREGLEKIFFNTQDPRAKEALGRTN